jgi:hypothetical protein
MAYPKLECISELNSLTFSMVVSIFSDFNLCDVARKTPNTEWNQPTCSRNTIKMLDIRRKSSTKELC